MRRRLPIAAGISGCLLIGLFFWWSSNRYSLFVGDADLRLIIWAGQEHADATVTARCRDLVDNRTLHTIETFVTRDGSARVLLPYLTSSGVEYAFGGSVVSGVNTSQWEIEFQGRRYEVSQLVRQGDFKHTATRLVTVETWFESE